MSILFLLALVLTLGYFRCSLWINATCIALWFLISVKSGIMSTLVLLIALPLVPAGLVIALIGHVRRPLISKRVQKWVRRILPPISKTEREAIDAGDVWYEANLLRGDMKFSQLLTWQPYQLNDEEKEFLNGPVEEFCRTIDDWQVVQKHWNLSDKSWEAIRKLGLFGLIIPKKFGGKGFSATAHSAIVSKIATKSASAATVVMVPNSLGPAELLMHYGTNDQKEYYLPRLAQGQEVPCFALTGVEAGSDAGSMPDYGVVCYKEYQGERILGISLTWEKRYITLAPVATLVGLAFKLYDPDKLLSEDEDRGITLCLIPSSHPGVEIGRRHNPLGMAFPNGPTSGKDVFVPMSFIIGGQEMIGQGWRMLMECLSVGRGISLPALATSVGHLSTLSCATYSRIRTQFKVPIGEFEGIQEALGEIAGLTYILESSRVMTAAAIDDGVKPAVTSAISKYHMTTMARTVINHTMDILGGKAIILGPRNNVAHPYMSMPISITVEGANILTRSLMIFGQGAIRCHPYLLSEMQYAQDDSQLQEFDKALLSHVGYTTSNVIRAFVHGVTCGAVVCTPKAYPLKGYIKRIQNLSSTLSVASDMALAVLGGSLKRKESLSAKLGDMMSYLYLATSVVSYHARVPDMKLEQDYVQWALEHCTYKAQEAFFDFAQNFPIRPLGIALRLLTFPWGRIYAKPSDKLTHTLARRLINNDPILSKLSHLNAHPGESEPLYAMQKAFALSFELSEALKRVAQFKRQAKEKYSLSGSPLIDKALEQGVINKEEAKSLHEFEHYRREVIMTDDFAFDEFARQDKVVKEKKPRSTNKKETQA